LVPVEVLMRIPSFEIPLQAGRTCTVWSGPKSSVPSKCATLLTLAAMRLGYGVVQRDLTIVNSALNVPRSVTAFRHCNGSSAPTSSPAAFILTAGAPGRFAVHARKQP
jgi:hypothetical protein